MTIAGAEPAARNWRLHIDAAACPLYGCGMVSLSRWGRDRCFWVAMGLGPLFWLVLYGVAQPAWRPGWPLAAPFVFLLPALVYPVLEEIVFRGLVQEALARRTARRWGPLSLANVLTSLAFAALHAFYHPPVWAAAVIGPSLVFGYFKERANSLVPPIVLHVFYNAGYYWLFATPVA